MKYLRIKKLINKVSLHVVIDGLECCVYQIYEGEYFMIFSAHGSWSYPYCTCWEMSAAWAEFTYRLLIYTQN